MARWIERTRGPQWLMDAAGRLLGYKDASGNAFSLVGGDLGTKAPGDEVNAADLTAADVARARAAVAGQFSGVTRGVRSFAGQYTHTAAFGNKTWRTNIELPVPAANIRAVRFAVASNPSGPVQLTAAVGPCATLAEANAAGGYAYAGFDGSDHNAFAPFVVAQKTQRQPDYVWSDWVTVRPQARSDGGFWACVSISLFAPNANVTMFGNATSDNTHNGGLVYPELRYQSYFADGDYVTANSMTMPNGGQPSQSLIAAVEFIADTRKAVYSVGHFSDSIAMGQLQTRKGRGAIVAAAAEINGEQSGFNVSPMLASFPGEAVQGSFRRMQQLFKADAGLPDFAIFRPYSPNNAGQDWPAITYMRTFWAECRAKGVIPILETGIYSSNNPGYEPARLAVNAAVRAFADENGIAVLELADIVTAANAASLLADGVHPNDACQLLMVPRYKSVIYSEVARLFGAA